MIALGFSSNAFRFKQKAKKANGFSAETIKD
jgi:hypothetical protein